MSSHRVSVTAADPVRCQAKKLPLTRRENPSEEEELQALKTRLEFDGSAEPTVAPLVDRLPPGLPKQRSSDPDLEDDSRHGVGHPTTDPVGHAGPAVEAQGLLGQFAYKINSTAGIPVANLGADDGLGVG